MTYYHLLCARPSLGFVAPSPGATQGCTQNCTHGRGQEPYWTADIFQPKKNNK